MKVAVISFHTWQEKYGSASSVVGAIYQINGHPFTIVGVAPPGFFGAKVADSGMPDFWLPQFRMTRADAEAVLAYLKSIKTAE